MSDNLSLPPGIYWASPRGTAERVLIRVCDRDSPHRPVYVAELGTEQDFDLEGYEDFRGPVTEDTSLPVATPLPLPKTAPKYVHEELASESHEWVLLDGTTLTGALKRYSQSSIVIERPNGTESAIAIDALDENCRNWLAVKLVRAVS